MENGHLIMFLLQVVGAAAAIVMGVLTGLRDRRAPRDHLDNMFTPYR
jgi:hypothetical protein